MKRRSFFRSLLGIPALVVGAGVLPKEAPAITLAPEGSLTVTNSGTFVGYWHIGVVDGPYVIREYASACGVITKADAP